jgi:4a-hydroxytetrahydrobiopterin dehydratase
MEKEDRMVCDLKFEDFQTAFAFMTRVALAAEGMDHHPTWTNTWNRVEIVLTTHSEGNTVTEKDRKLATLIEQFYLKMKP